MASLGLPGLAGFWGEFPAILAAYDPGGSDPNVALFRVYMVVAALGTVLAAAYLLWLYQRTAFGEPSEEFGGSHDGTHGSHGGVAHSLSSAANDDEHAHDEIYDVTPIEWVAWTPFLIGIVVLGVYPQLLFKVLNPAVTELVARLGETLG
jgi:NADH-quinone oxidoreductase subunit M